MGVTNQPEHGPEAPPLSKEQILKADDKPLGRAEVPEWGGHVRIRTFDIKEREEIETHISRAKMTGQKTHTRAKVLSMGIANHQGARIFTDADFALLDNRAAIVGDRLCAAILDHNGMTAEAQERDAKN